MAHVVDANCDIFLFTFASNSGNSIGEDKIARNKPFCTANSGFSKLFSSKRIKPFAHASAVACRVSIVEHVVKPSDCKRPHEAHVQSPFSARFLFLSTAILCIGKNRLLSLAKRNWIFCKWHVSFAPTYPSIDNFNSSGKFVINQTNSVLEIEFPKRWHTFK